MTGATIFLGVLIIAAITLIAVLIHRPEPVSSASGRLLAAFAFLALPGLLLVGGAGTHYERAKTTRFCVSCHVIGPYEESLRIDHPAFLPAAHYQNGRIPAERACYTCHTNYTMFGGLDDKMRGVRHVWHSVFRTASDPVHLYEPFGNRACLECHQEARSYLEEPAHARFLADLRRDARSCLMCHNLVHEVATLDRFGRWEPEASP